MMNKILMIIMTSVFCVSCISNTDKSEMSIDQINTSDNDVIKRSNFIEMGEMELDSSNGLYVIVSSKGVVEKNNLYQKVDSAKWIVYLTSILSDNKMYCNEVDEMGFLIEDTLNPVDFQCFTSLDLYLRKIKFEKDLMLFTFSFLNPEHDKFCNSVEINTTIGFIKDDEMIYRGGGDYEAFLQGSKLQKEAELEQRDKIYNSEKSGYTLYYYNSILQNYLDTTTCKLNPWFKEEAIKRGFKVH